jgi:hypothetical protein
MANLTSRIGSDCQCNNTVHNRQSMSRRLLTEKTCAIAAGSSAAPRERDRLATGPDISVGPALPTRPLQGTCVD